MEELPLWNAYTLNIPVTSAISRFIIVVETFPTSDFPVESLEFWEADVSGSGSVFTVTSPSWFGGKNAGETLSLTFQVGKFILL